MDSFLGVFHNPLICIAVVAALGLVGVVVAVAGAGSSGNLPAMSASELMAKMAQAEGTVTAVSGEISWRNTLFGDVGTSGMGAMPAQSPLLASGSGRVWTSEDGVRVESQGGAGDQIGGVDKAAHEAWTYDSATNTAKVWKLTGDLPAQPAMPTASPGMLTPAAITALLEQLAPYARVDVAGQGTVVGRFVYLLRMTPAAEDTALGAVQASIDGETMLPLRLEVFAKSGGPAVLQAGFDSISYAPVDASLFAFAPPAGAKVTTKQADAAQLQQKLQAKAEAAQAKEAKAGAGKGDGEADHQKLARTALLTIPEAQKLVDFPIASAQGYSARPFLWGYVFLNGLPVSAAGNPLFDLAQMGFGQASGSSSTAAAPQMGPVSVLLYGKGFGSIVLAQTKTTAELEKQLKQLPALVGTQTLNGAPVRSLTTALGGVYVWQQGDTTLVAGGMVPAADLKAFVESVQ